MPRTKNRKHESVTAVAQKINKWIEEHKDEILKNMLDTVGYEDTDKLWNDEYHGRFGLDCGWVWFYTKNDEQYHEWFLDNNRYTDYVSRINYPYNTQSTTLKEIQAKYILKNMGLENDYGIYVRLD